MPRLRATRANPPGMTATDADRRDSYDAALQQFDELIVAATAVGPVSRPLPLYYAVHQAGKAIAAAGATEGDLQKIGTHGLAQDRRVDAGKTGPRAVVDAVLASGHANQIRARAAGRGQVLAVTQALPCVWHVEFGPATVVRIVFVWALAEVGHVVVRRDQHAGGARTHSSTSLGQAVLAGVAIHVTSLAVRHRSASQVGRPSPHGLSRVSHASDQTATGPAPLKLSLHATTSSLTTPSGHAQDSGQTTSPCRDSCLRLHSGKAAAPAGVGARGRARPARLVVEAARVRDSSGVAKDTRGDPFPSKLALIAECRDALRTGRERGKLILKPCLFLDGRQPVHTLGSHRLVDVVRREA